MKKRIWWLLLGVIFLRLIIHIVVNQFYFFRTFDINFFSRLYSQSQYVLGSAAKRGISDDGLYTFAGYYYFFQKGDVSAVNFEHPPFGKYLIGLSILLFKNENIINIIYFLVLLLITYKIGKIILKNSLLSLVAIGILSFDPLFLDNLIRSLLDLPFTLFFTISIYFFLLALDQPKHHYLSMFFLGVAFSTRFSPFLIIIYTYLFFIIYFYKRKDMHSLLIASLSIPLVYLLSHIAFFIYHPSLLEFLRHKKWMLSWFRGSVTIVGNIWRNIFTSFYLDPTFKLVKNKHWIVVVPIIVSFALIPNKKFLKWKKNIHLVILYGLCVLYLIYVTVLTDGAQKFIMPIYPLLCIMAVGNLRRFYSIISAWKKRVSKHSKVN